MKVTAEILFFLFAKKYPLILKSEGLSGRRISAIKLYQAAETPEDAALYVFSEKKFSALSKEKKKNFSHIFLLSSGMTQKAELPAESKNKNIAVTNAFRTEQELYLALLLLYQTLLQEENELLLATLDPKASEAAFSFGTKWFPWEYSIVDIDMRLLYRSENLHKVLGGEKVSRIPMESIHDLILNREFHGAAKKKEVFYQNMTTNNITVMARNILPDNQYAGRVVMFLKESSTRAPKGAEELFEFYTDCVMETLRRSGHFTGRTQRDPLHLLCHSMLEGETASAHSVNDVLKRSAWKTDHAFSVIVFRFLSDSAWEAQLETTLPYLADELEIEWPYSCAVNTGTEIHWVLNLTLSDADTRPASFHQKVALFVRDHICVAGASPVFHDFTLLSDAKKSADAALEIGQKKNPHFWFFPFYDYHLDYVKEVLQNSLPSGLLLHPAIFELEQFDAANDTELSKTLKAYLEHGRNMTAAADAIYIHRTTFCRRMDRIKKITGIDLDDLNTVLLLELSYQFTG